MSNFLQLFEVEKPILAMLHMKGDTHEDKVERAKKEIKLYFDGGIDAVIAENYFGDYHVVEDVLAFLQKEYGDKVYGVNILNNFHRSYELSTLYGAKFMQVDSLAGHLPPALDAPYGKMIEAYRSCNDLQVLGGVRFKYQPYLSGRTLEKDMQIGLSRADGIVVTGLGTGLDTDDSKITTFRTLIGNTPLIIGAGLTPQTLGSKLALGDGAIVGSYFKDTYQDTGDVDPSHIAQFMEQVKTLRNK